MGRLAAGPCRKLLGRVGESIKEFSSQLSAMNTVFTQLLRRLQEGGGFREFGLCGECTQLCRQCAESEGAGPHRCGVTGEPLTGEEIGQICVNFESQPG